MSKEETLIASVKDKLKQLGDRKDSLENQLAEVQKELSTLKEKLDERESQIADLTEKNKVLKMAKSLSGSEDNTSETKYKINELVREIDKCIALLNK
ncbi:hypothetical protein [Halocola ammonii]